MRDYIEELVRADCFRVVEREVDPKFELAAVVTRSQAESDAPLLFRRVRGSRFPVVSNLYGSKPRLRDLIGADSGGFCRRWDELMRARAPAVAAAPAPAAGEVESCRLADLPHVTYFEKDVGPYLTAGVFLAKEPDTGVPNLSFHRCMMVNDAELRVRLGRTHDLTKYQAKAEARGAALEAAILIGPAPQFILAAAAPIPYGDSEIEVACRLAGRQAPMR
ncbi:MAG TPA: UbiD family decarboxylase domain-containing protein, partial [Burkholderiales bacterium]|nr:UbiD family decarboxylase domain-containing protein [Burkholderiales bacterium]